MASAWRRTMLYLGLGPDDEYEDDGRWDEPAPAREPAREPVRQAEPQRPAPSSGSGGRQPSQARPSNGGRSQSRPTGRPAGRPAQSRSEAEAPVARAVPAEASASPKPVVRAVPAPARPHVVMPESFNHAQEVADRFKTKQPVILNLQRVDKPLARRLLDFSSGICYSLGGHMEKVASQVYLLTPTDVEVSTEERRRLHDRGYAET